MVAHLSGEVDDKMMDLLVKSVNDLKDNDILTIYFTSSEGGYTYSAESIISCINLNKDKIQIIFYGELISCGMIIFLKTICKKRILKDTVGMYHLVAQKIQLLEGGKPVEGHNEFSLKQLKNSKKDKINYLKTIPLTEQEFNDIVKGKDVYFTYKRLTQILKDNGSSKSQ